MCVLGMSGELRDYGIAVNGLWPRTAIATSAIDLIGKNLFHFFICIYFYFLSYIFFLSFFPFFSAGEEMRNHSRTDEIMSDAAYIILVQDSKQYSGNFCIDEDILRAQGITDFDKYSVVPGTKDFAPDFFVEEEYKTPSPQISSEFLKDYNKPKL